MNGFKSGIATLVVAVIVLTAGASAFAIGGVAQWFAADEARSEELNRKHGLGEFAISSRDSSRRADLIRSEALNRKYGLGRHARKPASATAPQWLRALFIRSDALNRKYKLGEYAPGS